MDKLSVEKSNAVDAITSYSDINLIREALRLRPMDLLLFEMGISSGMRIKELLSLRVGDLLDGTANFNIADHPHVRDAFEKYLAVWKPANDDYIFRKSRKNEPLAFSTVTTMVKSWFTECGISGNFSSRSLYKTWTFMTENNSVRHITSATVYALTPVDTNSVQNQVREKLYKAIITGAIPAGTKLVVNRLARQLECTALQIRVALAHLEGQGMVKMRTSKACMVRSVSPEDIREMSKLRVVLEGYAMDMLHDKWNPETAVILKRILEKWRDSRDVAESVHLHSSFHEMLYRDLNMPILSGYIHNLAERMNAMHIRHYLTKHREEPVMDDEVNVHVEIYRHMIAGDFDAAKQGIIENIKIGEYDGIEHLKAAERLANAMQENNKK